MNKLTLNARSYAVALATRYACTLLSTSSFVSVSRNERPTRVMWLQMHRMRPGAASVVGTELIAQGYCCIDVSRGQLCLLDEEETYQAGCCASCCPSLFGSKAEALDPSNILRHAAALAFCTCLDENAACDYCKHAC